MTILFQDDSEWSCLCNIAWKGALTFAHAAAATKIEISASPLQYLWASAFKYPGISPVSICQEN